MSACSTAVCTTVYIAMCTTDRVRTRVCTAMCTATVCNTTVCSTTVCSSTAVCTTVCATTVCSTSTMCVWYNKAVVLRCSAHHKGCQCTSPRVPVHITKGTNLSLHDQRYKFTLPRVLPVCITKGTSADTKHTIPVYTTIGARAHDQGYYQVHCQRY